MAGKHLALFITLVAVVSSENSAEEKVFEVRFPSPPQKEQHYPDGSINGIHYVTFEKSMKDAVDDTVDVFNVFIRPVDDRIIYDAVKVQFTMKRMEDSWFYDRIDMDLLKTNCSKDNVTSFADCVLEPVETGTSTDPTQPKEPLHFGISLISEHLEAKFEQFLEDSIDLGISTFNFNSNDYRLYEAVKINTTVKRTDNDVWIYDHLELVLRPTDCLAYDSLDGCAVIEE